MLPVLIDENLDQRIHERLGDVPFSNACVELQPIVYMVRPRRKDRLGSKRYLHQ